jgi:HEAT repeats
MRSHPTAPARGMPRTFRRAPFALVLSAAIGVAFAFRAPPAHAGKKAPAKETPKDAPRADLKDLEKRLAGSEGEVVAALQSIAESGSTETAPLVGALLGRGGSPKVLDEALKTASKLKVESLSPAIAPYVQHRAEAIRHAAVRALLKTKGTAAVEALKKALRSSDAVVRGTAATGLGALGAKDALPDLFRAFDHGVAEAGAALGQLCTPAQCEEYAERTGKVAFDVMVTGFDQILFRAPNDIPDDEKIRLIGRMRELGTAEVGKYLADVGDRWPKEWSVKVKQAIDSAAHAVGGGSKK